MLCAYLVKARGFVVAPKLQLHFRRHFYRLIVRPSLAKSVAISTSQAHLFHLLLPAALMEEASDPPATLHDAAWTKGDGGPENKASVMEPYVRGMRHLKLIGLPVRISVKDGGVVTFSDRFRRTKCGIKVGNYNL